MVHPTGLAVFEDDLYWANHVNYHHDDTTINKILTANKFLANSSARPRPTDIVSRLPFMTSELHIFHAAVQMPGKNLRFCPTVLSSK